MPASSQDGIPFAHLRELFPSASADALQAAWQASGADVNVAAQFLLDSTTRTAQQASPAGNSSSRAGGRALGGSSSAVAASDLIILDDDEEPPAKRHRGSDAGLSSRPLRAGPAGLGAPASSFGGSATGAALSDAALAKRLQAEEDRGHRPLGVNCSHQQNDDESLALRLQEQEQQRASAAAQNHPDRVKAKFLTFNAVVFSEMTNETEQRELLRDCFQKLQLKESAAFSGLGSGAAENGATAMKAPPVKILSYQTGWLPDQQNESPPCCIELAKNHYDKFSLQCGNAIRVNNDRWCAADAVQLFRAEHHGGGQGSSTAAKKGRGRSRQAPADAYPGWRYDNASALYKFRADESLAQSAAPLVYVPNPPAESLRLPQALSFGTKTLWARMYGPHTALGFHQDPPPCGWVFLINLGATARFAFYHPLCPERVVRCKLKSGDALLFNGEVLLHAVEAIETESCSQQWWQEMATELGFGADVCRIGLQMRVSTML